MQDFEALKGFLGLGPLLEALREGPGYQLVAEWPQGEFHHDVVVRTGRDVLIVSTNCNGGIKELTLFDALPERWSLWSERCPENEEFRAQVTQPLPPVKARHRTVHWFNPCELLVQNARSELLPSCRKRAFGGGWEAL